MALKTSPVFTGAPTFTVGFELFDMMPKSIGCSRFPDNIPPPDEPFPASQSDLKYCGIEGSKGCTWRIWQSAMCLGCDLLKILEFDVLYSSDSAPTETTLRPLTKE